MMLTALLCPQVAVNRFIDDVSNLAIEDCLIRKLPELFRSGNVMAMSSENISQLAGETMESAKERKRLEEKCRTLKSGLQDLKSLQKRRDIVKPITGDRVATEDPEETTVMTQSGSEKASNAINSTDAGPAVVLLKEPSPY